MILEADMLPGGPGALRQDRRAEVPVQVQLAEGRRCADLELC